MAGLNFDDECYEGSLERPWKLLVTAHKIGINVDAARPQ